MVIEVTKWNFRDLYPKIEHAIRNADFIAIDSEFSGLWFDYSCKPSLFDSSEKRYLKLRKSVQKFTVTQIGLSIFSGTIQGSSNIYTVQTYVFHVFPASFDVNDARITLQASCVEFLCKHKFDFNKWLYDGLPYMNCEEEEQLQEQLDSGYLASGSERCVDEREVQSVCSLVASWIPQSKTGDFLNLPLSDDVPMYVLHQDLRSRFLQIWTSMNPFEQLVVERVSPEQRASLEKEGADTDRQQRAQFQEDLLGFTRVFRLMKKARKPLVGHNLWMDLLFLYEKCHKPLPDKFEDFKQDFHSMFPVVYDTKHISYESKKILNCMRKSWPGNLKELYDLVNSTAVMNTALCQPSVRQDDDVQAGRPHQAGYDAFMSGVVFMRLCHLLHAQKMNAMEMTGCMFKSYIPSMRQFCNRVNVIRAVVNYLQLDDIEPPSIRPPLLHVEAIAPGGRLSSEQLACWFSVHGTVDIQLVGSTRAKVATGSYHVARDIIYAFEDHEEIKVTKYRFWQHSRTAQGIWWGTFAAASGTCLVLLMSIFR